MKKLQNAIQKLYDIDSTEKEALLKCFILDSIKNYEANGNIDLIETFEISTIDGDGDAGIWYHDGNIYVRYYIYDNPGMNYETILL